LPLGREGGAGGKGDGGGRREAGRGERERSDVTVEQFAEVLKVPVDRLLAQLEKAGIKSLGPKDHISEDAKQELLTHLRKQHGKAEDGGAPRKITLRRKAQSEIKVAAPMGKARTVSVEVRRQRTYIKRDVLEEQVRVAQEALDQQREQEDAQRAAAEALLRREVEVPDLQPREREKGRRRTGEEATETVMAANQRCAFDFLAKPFSFHQLNAAVREALAAAV